jgi:seryl-tRNA(Sec) selenium transferase
MPLEMMRSADMDALRTAVEGWLAAVGDRVPARVLEVDGAIGGGSLPGRTWPSVALALRPKSVEQLRQRLLSGDPPVVPRAVDGELIFDARSIVPLGQGADLLRALEAALQ